MGMPMYGRAFTLDKNENSLSAPARCRGTAGPFTGEGGFLAYYEICHLIKNEGWKVVKDSQDRIGPYAYKGTVYILGQTVGSYCPHCLDLDLNGQKTRRNF